MTIFRPVTLAQHAATYAFNDLVVCYARAVCVDVLDLHHASTMLIHYDRFGPFFNECCRWLGDAVRQFEILGEAGHAAAGVAVESLKGVSSLSFHAKHIADKMLLISLWSSIWPLRSNPNHASRAWHGMFRITWY